MALVSSETIETTQHRSGARARYRYTFDNGRVVNLGPCFLQSLDDVESIRISLESKALSIAKRKDAEPILRSDSSVSAIGEATKRDVARQFLEKAMKETDTSKAYLKLKRFNEFRVSEGYTVAQVKAALNITDSQWDKIIARWTHLNGNSSAIEAYIAIAGNDPGGRQ